MTGGLAGGVVAGDSEQHEERGDVGVGEPITVHLGSHQAGEQVVAGMLAALRGEHPGHLMHVCLRLEQHLQRVATIEVLRVARRDHGVGRVRQPLPLRLGDAHHVRQRANGQLLGAEVDEIGAAACGFELLARWSSRSP